MVSGALESWREKLADDVLARVEFQGGDMFDSIPTARADDDLFMLFDIFHGLSDADGKPLLANLRQACGGRTVG